jgi:hypothetical protein
MTKAEILKMVRQNCIDCMGGHIREVENCTSKNCSLFSLRAGKDPSPSKAKGDAMRMRFSAKKSLVAIN